MKAANLVGKHFGYLTIVRRAPNSREGKTTLNISPATLSNRLLSGWPEDDLGMAPNLNNKNIRSGKYA